MSNRRRSDSNRNIFRHDLWWRVIAIVFFIVVLHKKSKGEKNYVQSTNLNVESRDREVVTQAQPKKFTWRYILSLLLFSSALALLAWFLVYKTTAVKDAVSFAPDQFTWGWNQGNLHEFYSTSLSLKILPDSTDIDGYVSTKIRETEIKSQESLSETDRESIPYFGKYKDFYFVWPGDIELISSAGKVSDSIIPWHPGTQVKVTDRQPHIHFLWKNGLQTVSFAQKKLSLRFGDIVNSSWHTNPWVHPYETLNISIEIPPNYQIVYENPSPIVTWTSTDSWFGEGKKTHSYEIEVGYGPEASEASTDLELIIVDTSLLMLRDIFILLAGLLLGLSANLLTELFIFFISKKWRH